MRGKRQPRVLSLEAIPCPRATAPLSESSLKRAFVAWMAECIQAALKEGKLVVVGGVIRVNSEKVDHEQKP
jgi:hypothetical protein